MLRVVEDRATLNRMASVAAVDDDPKLRTLLEEELQDLGVDPVLCDNGAELMALLHQRPKPLAIS